MKRILLATTLVSILGVGGIVAAQATKPDEHAAHHPSGAAAAPDTQSTPGAMGGGMMGNGMMGGGMGGGMCPMMGGGMMGGGMMGGGMMGGMMGGAKTKVDVKKIDKGVTITMTSPDAATVARIQKMAEAMRLMHEAMSQ
jgi:hypothetical protein